jgi:hypothetical protein
MIVIGYLLNSKIKIKHLWKKRLLLLI